MKTIEEVLRYIENTVSIDDLLIHQIFEGKNTDEISGHRIALANLYRWISGEKI